MDKYERPSDVVTYHISELPQKEQERIAQMFEDVQKRLKWDTRRKWIPVAQRKFNAFDVGLHFFLSSMSQLLDPFNITKQANG